MAPDVTREADAPRTEPNTEAASYIEDDPEAWSGWVDTVRRYGHHFGPLIAELGSEEAAASVLGGTILAYLADQHGLYLRHEAATPADSLDALRLYEAAHNVWPSHEEGYGGTGSAPSASWRVLEPAVLSKHLIDAIAAEYDRLRTGQRSPRNDEPEPLTDALMEDADRDRALVAEWDTTLPPPESGSSKPDDALGRLRAADHDFYVGASRPSRSGRCDHILPDGDYCDMDAAAHRGSSKPEAAS